MKIFRGKKTKKELKRNSVGGLNHRLGTAEKRITKLEVTTEEVTYNA